MQSVCPDVQSHWVSGQVYRSTCQLAEWSVTGRVKVKSSCRRVESHTVVTVRSADGRPPAKTALIPTTSTAAHRHVFDRRTRRGNTRILFCVCGGPRCSGRPSSLSASSSSSSASVIVFSHWPHFATHVATQVAQLVASVKGLVHKLPNLLLNVFECRMLRASAASSIFRRHVEFHGYSLPIRKWNS